MTHTTKSTIETIAIIGAGAAGLITAHVLLQDGFNVEVITRDKTVGGVWARERVYPGLSLDSVHGEFRFSALSMDAPINSAETGGRLTGEDMSTYFELFADTHLRGKFRFETDVVNIRRVSERNWIVKTSDGQELRYSRVVLCTGGCSKPNVPPTLSPLAAEAANFRGLVLHSSQFKSRLDAIFNTVPPVLADESTDGSMNTSSIVVVGGGKSASDMAGYLASQGRKVTIVFESLDRFLAVSKPLPDFIRKSRLMAIMSPHIELHTRLERFLHNTILGGKLVRFFWNKLEETSYAVYSLADDSPLRSSYSMLWSMRVSDEGVHKKHGFHALANEGIIEVIKPARAVKFSEDGRSLMLNNGRCVPADVVILATGYSSSWNGVIDEDTASEIGIGRQPPQMEIPDEWNYTSLANPPPLRAGHEEQSSSLYRGLVPAKNINARDFAVNGALFTVNNGYTFEVAAHWISSYFLNDKMRIPESVEGALKVTERNSAWVKKRYPGMLAWTNESYSGNLAFFTYPQATDELLEDMGLPIMRSGGNWLTWPFKVIDVNEIATLTEERRQNRITKSL